MTFLSNRDLFFYMHITMYDLMQLVEKQRKNKTIIEKMEMER